MHKIKKGIKKKIKGKKGKHNDDEIFTEEELEQYKREKAEEARRLAEEGHQHHDPDDPLDETVEDSHYVEDQQESHNSPKEGEQDWKSFLATTDTVLKKTSDNLEHIKESSYFQAKKGFESDEAAPLQEPAEAFSQRASACTSPVQVVAAAAKNWVDLDKEGIDDDTEGQLPGEHAETKPVSPPKKKHVELKPIEDLPDVSAEDYADVFDTTFVDQVESGDLKLIIPDSPTDEYSNEPDPFDTSAVDKVLHINEPEPEPEPQVISGTKKGEQPKKRKIQLVSLGNAVDVLTGKAPAKSKEDEANQISLLGDFEEESSEPINKETKEKEVLDAKDKTDENEQVEKEKCEEHAETNAIDDILFGGDESIENLPEVGVPDLSLINELIKKPAKKTDAKSDEQGDLNVLGDDEEKIDDEFNVNEKVVKPIPVDDIISEFDVIDKVAVTDETLISKPAESDILDEFDAEFASIAHESIAKAKEKEIDELGLDDDEDPFDTSYVPVEALGNENANSEDDPFDVKLDGDAFEAIKAKKPARPALPKALPLKPDLLGADHPTNDELEDVDPFDTSIVNKVLPVDHLETTENDADLASTLEPEARNTALTRSESFDPFDTSAAEAFGVTELKVLESELLTNVQTSNQLTRSDSDDFDFDPRAGEEIKERIPPKEDLLSSEVELGDSSVLKPQEQNKEEEELDPFDTSFAEKIQIKSLEEELLDKPSVASEPHPETLQVKSKPPPRPASPASLLIASPVNEDIAPSLQPVSFSNVKDNLTENLEEEIDPFDTSIADAYGQVELKALESELLATNESVPLPNPSVVAEVTGAAVSEKDSLQLKVKPPRPQSPACLLAATPVDENPTLLPQAQAAKTEEDDFDPFDTSIAQQFGKTELQVLESQLLSGPAQNLDDDFDPRAVTPEPVKPPRPQRPASPREPTCLLSSDADTGAAVDVPIAPTSPQKKIDENFDPFDTSIANKLGTTELKSLENELFSQSNVEDSESTLKASVVPEDLNIEIKDSKPLQPPQQCLLATTPTDSSQPLQPLKNCSSKQDTEVEDFDPFDTSIANQFGKTEIKQLETTLLSEKPKPVSPNLYNSVIQKTTPLPADCDPFDTSIAEQHCADEFDSEDFDPRGGEASQTKDTWDLLDSTEEIGATENPVGILQPQESKDIAAKEDEDIDPFDTSIASSILPGKTELKLLESELLNS